MNENCIKKIFLRIKYNIKMLTQQFETLKNNNKNNKQQGNPYVIKRQGREAKKQN